MCLLLLLLLLLLLVQMVREGTDVSIFTYSRMRYVVMQAVAELEKKGYNPEVRLPVLHLLHCSTWCPAPGMTSAPGCKAAAVLFHPRPQWKQ
jgi:hypothetical protein